MFRSAGFMRSGKETPETLSDVLADRQISTASHRSHKIDSATMDAADIILTMEGRHIQQLTLEHQPALAKALPLKEAADRLRTANSLEELLAQLESRNLADYLGVKWDVDDPYKRGKRRYKKMVEEVNGLLGQVITPLIN